MKSSSRLLLYLCLLAFPLVLVAQTPIRVTAKLDSAEMFMGEQTNLQISVTHPSSQAVAWPTFSNKQLIPGLEIVKSLPTTTHDGEEEGAVISSKTFVITSFDPSLYYIPPIVVKVGGRTVKTEQLALKVNDVPIDTVHVDKYFGPKDVITPAYTWAEWRPVFFLSLLLLALLGTFFVLLHKLGRTRRVVVVKPKPVEQPYAWALRMIQQFRQQYDEGSYEPKDYYTRLVDILRGYLNRRYHINASEMTSSQILDQLSVLTDEADRLALRRLLQTADLVKFAKLHTSAGDDRQNLLKMSEFVEASKLNVQPTEHSELAEQPDTSIAPDSAAPEPQPQVVTAVKSRHCLLVLLVTSGIAFLVVLACVIIDLVNLL